MESLFGRINSILIYDESNKNNEKLSVIHLNGKSQK